MTRDTTIGALQGKIGPGVAAVGAHRPFYDVQDRAVAVQDTVAGADKHRFRYEVRLR
jgi:hypothetical protein